MAAHRSYPNPQLVCDFRFTPPVSASWQPTALGEFFKAVQSAYPQLEPITEQSLELVVAPDGMPAQRMGSPRVRFRLRHAAKPILITITEGVLTFHALPPYPGWNQFKHEMEAIWPKFLDGSTPESIQQTGMRYINRIPRRESDETPRQWLRASDYVTPALLDSAPGFVSRIEVQVNSANRRMVTIAP